MVTKMSRLRLFLMSFMCSLLLQVTALTFLSPQGSLLPVFAEGVAEHHLPNARIVQTCNFPLTFSGIGKNHIRISSRSGRHGRYSIRRSCSGCCHGLRPYATRNMLKRSPRSSDQKFAPRDGMKFAPMCKGKENCLQRRSKCVAWVVCVC